jgi:tetratricopeptide (TPR) repeat protein
MMKRLQFFATHFGGWFVLAGLVYAAVAIRPSRPDGQALLQQANELGEPLIEKGQEAPAARVREAARAYKQVIKAAPGSKRAAEAEESTGRLYLAVGDPGKARQSFERIPWYYPRHRDMSVMAMIYTARSYEAEGNWDAAAETYRSIKWYHPFTTLGMQSPLYLAEMHERRGDRLAAVNAYRDAIVEYLRRLSNAPNLAFKVKVKGYLAIAYRRLQETARAQQVIEELMALREQSPRPDVLMALGWVFDELLEHPVPASVFYGDLVSRYPDDPLASDALKELTRLESKFKWRPLDVRASTRN